MEALFLNTYLICLVIGLVAPYFFHFVLCGNGVLELRIHPFLEGLAGSSQYSMSRPIVQFSTDQNGSRFFPHLLAADF